MRKSILMAVLSILLFGCLAPKKNVTSGTSVINSVADTAGFAATHLVEEIPANAAVVFSNTSKTEIELVDYVIEEISSKVVSSKKLQIAQRNENMESVMRELDFQMTGATSDETFAGIGHFVGAQYIVNCYISGTGIFRHFSVMALDVRTGLTQVQKPYPIIEVPDLTSVNTTSVKTPSVNPILENLVLNREVHPQITFLADNTDKEIKRNELNINNLNVIITDIITFEGNKRGGFGPYISDVITAKLRENENLIIQNRIDVNSFLHDNLNYLYLPSEIDFNNDKFLARVANDMGANLIVKGRFRTLPKQKRIRIYVYLIGVKDDGTPQTLGAASVDLPEKDFNELNMVMD